MSVRLAFQETAIDPAEYDYTRPMECVVCGQEHDTDDDTGRSVVEGFPWGDGVICYDCRLTCAKCGVDVIQATCWNGCHSVVKDGVTWDGETPYCAACSALTGETK